MTTIYIAVAEIAARYRVHRSTVWRWAKFDPDFPQPVSKRRLSPTLFD